MEKWLGGIHHFVAFNKDDLFAAKNELRVTFRVTFRVTKIAVTKTKCVEKRDV